MCKAKNYICEENTREVDWKFVGLLLEIRPAKSTNWRTFVSQLLPFLSLIVLLQCVDNNPYHEVVEFQTDINFDKLKTFFEENKHLQRFAISVGPPKFILTHRHWLKGEKGCNECADPFLHILFLRLTSQQGQEMELLAIWPLDLLKIAACPNWNWLWVLPASRRHNSNVMAGLFNVKQKGWVAVQSAGIQLHVEQFNDQSFTFYLQTLQILANQTGYLLLLIGVLSSWLWKFLGVCTFNFQT